MANVRRGRRRIRWGRLTAALIALGALIGGYLLYTSIQPANAFRTAVTNKNPPAFRHRVTILLLGNALSIINGKDQTNPYVKDRTDTMMLVSFNPSNGAMSVLSVPRDTLVPIPHVGMTKINEANYFGGPKLAVKLVEQTLHVPVDYYMETTMWNFMKIINAIGGLTVDVTTPMHYGGTGNVLDINLNPGVQHLNGQQVLEYVRFRQEALGDIGRIQQQQYIVKLIMKKVLTPRYITKLPSVVSMLAKDIVYTNLSRTQIASLGLLATRIHLSQVQFATVPGKPTSGIDPYMHVRLDYWVANQRLIRLIDEEIVEQRPISAAVRRHLYITVESGTGSLAPADQVAAYLRKQGYTVTSVVWANNHSTRQNAIVNYTGDKYLAQRIARALGTSADTTITNDPYHDYPHLDLEIIVGEDLHLNTNVQT